MNNNNILDNKLDAYSDSLTYRTLRSLLPAVSEPQLPSLKAVQSGRYDESIFYSGAVIDGMMTIFRQGFYLYEERATATVRSVSMAGSVMNKNYTSTTTDAALDMEKLVNLPWYWPLTIAGKVRLEQKRDKYFALFCAFASYHVHALFSTLGLMIPGVHYSLTINANQELK